MRRFIACGISVNNFFFPEYLADHPQDTCFLFDNAAFGGSHEIDDVFYFGGGLKVLANFLYAFFFDAFGIEQAIGVVDEFNEFVAEPVAAQAYHVDACIACWLFSSNDVGRDVLRESASALYHCVAPYTAKLMT